MKVQELMGTRYLTGDYAEEFTFLFQNFLAGISSKKLWNKKLQEFVRESIEKNKIVLDFAEVAICMKVWKLVDQFMHINPDKIELSDSVDAERDRYFKDSVQLCRNPPKTVPLPNPPYRIKELHEYINSLDKNVVYDGGTEDRYRKVAAFISIVAPDVQITFTSWTDYFEYMSDKCCDILEDYDDFYYLPNGMGGFWDTHVEDGKVYILNRGMMSKDVFLRTYKAIPTCIGTQNDLAKSSDVWSKILMSILEDIEDLSPRTPVLLKDFLEVNNDS